MATRNLSAKYGALRATARSNRAAANGPNDAAADTTTGGEPPATAQAADHGTTPGETPQWVAIHDTVSQDLVQIKAGSQYTPDARALQKLHAIRLKVSFGENVVAEQQSDIDRQQKAITDLLFKCENNLKRIALVGNNGSLTSQEKTTRLNVMRSLSTEMSQASKSFQHIQKDFYRNLRDQEKVGEQFFSSADGTASVSLGDALDNSSGLTESQMAELQQIEAQSSSREKEIIRIAKSVNELAVLFKDLNMLVLEQGTILDRIDYNIETSLSKIKKGVVDLEVAEKTSRKALATKCIFVLAIMAVFLLIVFIAKKSA